MKDDADSELKFQDYKRRTPLHYAVLSNKRPVVELILSIPKANNELEVIETQDYADRAALHIAAINERVEALDVLLTNGANLDAIDEFKNTPLHLAAKYGSVGAAKMILIARRDDVVIARYVNAKNYKGKTAVHLAHKNLYVLQLLIDAKGDEERCIVLL